MCLTIGSADIGSADVVLDTDEHLLVFNETIEARDRPSLARRVLAEHGIPQPDHAAVCICGQELFLLPLPDQRKIRQAITDGLDKVAIIAAAGMMLAPNLHNMIA